MNADNRIKKLYPTLGAKERYALMVAAGARGDWAERDLLAATAPKVTFEFPNTKGLADGFDDLTTFHVMQQLGTAGMFWMLTYVSESNEGKLADQKESALTLAARRFLEGQDAFKAVCAEYGIDPEVAQDAYNRYPELTAFTEIIMRTGFELSETELTDLEKTKQIYREVIEQARELGAENKASRR